MNIDSKQQLKVILALENLSLSSLARLLTEKTGKKWYQQTLFTKLKNGNLRYDEMKLICDLLGYEIVVKKR